MGKRGRVSSRRSSSVSANTSTEYLSDSSGSAGIRAASGDIDVGSSRRIDASDFDGRYDDGRDTPLDLRASRTTICGAARHRSTTVERRHWQDSSPGPRLVHQCSDLEELTRKRGRALSRSCEFLRRPTSLEWTLPATDSEGPYMLSRGDNGSDSIDGGRDTPINPYSRYETIRWAVRRRCRSVDYSESRRAGLKRSSRELQLTTIRNRRGAQHDGGAGRSLAVFRRPGERPTSESGEEVALAKYGGPSSKSCPSGTICQQGTTVKGSPGPLAVTRIGGWHCPQQFHEVSTVGRFYGWSFLWFGAQRRPGERLTSDLGKEVAQAKTGGPSSKPCPSGTNRQRRTVGKGSPGPSRNFRVTVRRCSSVEETQSGCDSGGRALVVRPERPCALRHTLHFGVISGRGGGAGGHPTQWCGPGAEDCRCGACFDELPPQTPLPTQTQGRDRAAPMERRMHFDAWASLRLLPPWPLFERGSSIGVTRALMESRLGGQLKTPNQGVSHAYNSDLCGTSEPSTAETGTVKGCIASYNR